MARIARLVVPNIPHHVTQRGNRRQRTFFCREDYLAYIALVAELKHQAGVDIWAYCLMPNHVHLIVVPEHPDALADLFREAHKRYTRKVNFREGWRGHLWQERFHSSAMDDAHLHAAVRYVELNPVRANLCSRPQEWPWSSVHAHLTEKDDQLVAVAPMLHRVDNWAEYLGQQDSPELYESIRNHEKSGRPLGSDLFIENLEQLTGRDLCRRNPGPRSRPRGS